MTVPPAAVHARNQAQPLTVDDAYARSHRAALAPSRIGPDDFRHRVDPVPGHAIGHRVQVHQVGLDLQPDRADPRRGERRPV